MIVYLRPFSPPMRSERRLMHTSAVRVSASWMSPSVLPSPLSLSGSSDVTLYSTKVGFGSQTSVTVTESQTSTSLWLGGQSTLRSITTSMTGGVVSTTVTFAVHESGLPSLSTVLNVTMVSPSGKHLSLIHISEPTRLLSISYAVFCLKKKKKKKNKHKILYDIEHQ